MVFNIWMFCPNNETVYLLVFLLLFLLVELIISALMNSKLDYNLTKVMVKWYVTLLILIITLLILTVKSGMEKVNTSITIIKTILKTKLNQANKLIDWVWFILSNSSLLGRLNLNSIMNKGARIAIRSKVNESVISGLSMVDTILPIGRGQRQLILGDRNTGKSSVFLNTLITSSRVNSLSSIDGFGAKRLFGLYIAINQNLSKLVKFMDYLNHYEMSGFTLVLATHASSPAMLGYLLPLVGVSISERLRDRGVDVLIGFDDLSKHAKAYRQISLLLGKIPSRDAYPSDIFNVHSALLERVGKLRLDFLGGSITAFPVIETINSDITEFIATNVISITDGQVYTNRTLFLNGIRPAIDSALSVSRIGSAAQMKFTSLLSSGLKNEVTNLRVNKDVGSLSIIDGMKLNSLESIFTQFYLHVNNVEITLMLLLAYKNNVFITDIYEVLYCTTFISMYFSYLLFLCQQNFNVSNFNLLTALFKVVLFLFCIPPSTPTSPSDDDGNSSSNNNNNNNKNKGSKIVPPIPLEPERSLSEFPEDLEFCGVVEQIGKIGNKTLVYVRRVPVPKE